MGEREIPEQCTAPFIAHQRFGQFRRTRNSQQRPRNTDFFQMAVLVSGRVRWRLFTRLRSFGAMHHLSMRDTTMAADRIRLAAVRQMEPAERLRQMFALSESARGLALSGLRERYVGLTDLELVEILLGQRLVPRAERPLRP